jgi:restriction endonuclease Mrr
MKIEDLLDALTSRLIRVAGDRGRIDISEKRIISLLEEVSTDRLEALELWEVGSRYFERVVRDGYVMQWDYFRRAIRVSKLPTVEELQSAAEIYELATPEEVERKIRGLTGVEFERFLGAILGRMPAFRNVVTTQGSHDGGVDLRGHYIPSSIGPQFDLLGQAKQWKSAVTASQARDFIGALDTCGRPRVIGLFVSTSGYTRPAIDTFDKSRYNFIRWEMIDLIGISQGLATRRVEVSFSVPDETFWDEVLGPAQTV